MLEIFAYVLGALALAALAVVLVASRKPDVFTVERSLSIAAPPERIYPLIANLRAMNTWNPFVEPDPAIRITYEGPEQGKGARHTWVGNRKVGEGSIDITEAEPSRRVAMRLFMLKPMKADNHVEFALQPSGTGTTVTWSMRGQQPLVGKVMTMFIDCDNMVGGQFEKGLASLKQIAEGTV